MKHFAKKLIASICSATMLAGAAFAPSFSIEASAASGTVTIDGVTYDYVQDYMGVAITKCYSNGKQTVTIPNQISTSEGVQDVLAIYDSAFYGSSVNSIVNLYMNSGSKIYKIGKNFCRNCDNLQTIQLSTKLTQIGDYSFYDTDGLHSITFPNSVKRIGAYVCNWSWNLYDVTIGSDVEIIGANAFARMRDLNNFNSSSSSLIYQVGEGVLANSKWATDRANDDALYIGYNNRVLLRWQRGGTNPTVTLGNNVRVLADKAFGGSWAGSHYVRTIICPRVEYIGNSVFTSVPSATVRFSASIMYNRYGNDYATYVSNLCAPATVVFMH